MKDLIKQDLKLTDAQTSYPLTGMILVYMLVSPLFGWVSDRRLVGRRPLLTAAVVFWSAATALASLSNNLVSLVRVSVFHVAPSSSSLLGIHELMH